MKVKFYRDIQKYLGPIFNLSLRFVVHLFIFGSLFFFFKNYFDMSLRFGVIAAFLVAVGNEIVEAVNKVENSFHTRYVFKRDRLLAGLAFLYTTVIITLHWAFATFFAPLSLMALTSYMDSKLIRVKTAKRNLIKPFADITACTLGPLACILVLRFIK